MRLEQARQAGKQMRMKLRHATALTLIGWYLMAPPMTKSTLPYDPPTKLWQIQQTFSSKADCEASLAKLKSDPARLPMGKPICIESKDDPDFR